MARHQLELFVTPSDVSLIAQTVEKWRPIKYAVAGSSESGDVRVLKSAAEVFANATSATSVSSAFLVLDATGSVVSRRVPQATGGVRYTVDQIANPASVVLRPGMFFDEVTLVAGQVGTASDDRQSLELLSLFSKAVKKVCVKVKSYWVGPHALILLDSGGRLTANVKSPREYDLER